MKEVIELTRVLIPVGVVSLFLKLFIELLATFVFTDATYVSLSVLVLRCVSFTIYFSNYLFTGLGEVWLMIKDNSGYIVYCLSNRFVSNFVDAFICIAGYNMAYIWVVTIEVHIFILSDVISARNMIKC